MKRMQKSDRKSFVQKYSLSHRP